VCEEVCGLVELDYICALDWAQPVASALSSLGVVMLSVAVIIFVLKRVGGDKNAQ